MERQQIINKYLSVIKGKFVKENSEISNDIIKLFDYLSTIDLMRTFIISDRKTGMTYKELSEKYSITTKQVLWIVKEVVPESEIKYKVYK